MLAIGEFSYWDGKGKYPDLYGHFNMMVETESPDKFSIMKKFKDRLELAKEAIATQGWDEKLYELDEFFWTIGKVNVCLDSIFLIKEFPKEPVVFSAEVIGLKMKGFHKITPNLSVCDEIEVMRGSFDEPFFTFD